MPLTSSQTQILERYKKNLPRFLFRGFHSRSGGGIPRLNSAEGIIPHGFLGGQIPTSIHNIPNLKRMIDGHLQGGHVPSYFSSWAADLSAAVYYSQLASNADTGHIAIIDTSLLERHVEIYHVKALSAAGLASGTYAHEYLAYGPIAGRAYHCVKYTDIIKAGMNLLTNPYHQHGFHHLSSLSESQAQDLGTRIATVALLFRYPSDDQPDVIITMVAILIGYDWVIATEADARKFGYILARCFEDIFVQFVLQRLRMHRSPNFSQPLVNRNTYTAGFPRLKHAVHALTWIQGHISRVLDAEL
ncbi:hypothetical protein F4776DRAFT_676388 [Hypoxylon sp. NC0597]|nr:hypothetical protein F4776DRAFT_676388 [Hypoxylon sp. NC0597]